jgi:hypothetical protein
MICCVNRYFVPHLGGVNGVEQNVPFLALSACRTSPGKSYGGRQNPLPDQAVHDIAPEAQVRGMEPAFFNRTRNKPGRCSQSIADNLDGVLSPLCHRSRSVAYGLRDIVHRVEIAWVEIELQPVTSSGDAYYEVAGFAEPRLSKTALACAGVNSLEPKA